MQSDPELQALLKDGQLIWDIRQEPEGLGVGRGNARSLSCRRILTVGTDMSVGKMSASLELNRAAQRQGIRSKFLATGQSGLMIAGDGIPLDTIRVNFAAGAVEQLVLHYGSDRDLLFVSVRQDTVRIVGTFELNSLSEKASLNSEARSSINKKSTKRVKKITRKLGSWLLNMLSLPKSC